jgi:trigger factor
MKKYVKMLLITAAALTAVTGCSKKSAEETTAAETTAEAEIDKGSVKTLGQYKGIELEKDSDEVTDEELDERIQQILDANPEYIEVDRPAQDGDTANIDYVGMKDGEAFSGGTAEGYDLVLGSGTFIPGFEDGLIGANTGDELSLNLTFPENYSNTDLAGQAVVFDVTVNSIKEKKDAVLDDAFVQRMSDFTTVDEFKEDTRNDMQEQKATAAEQKLQNDGIQAVVDASEFDLNQDAVDQSYNDQINYITTMVSTYYGMELEDYVKLYGMTMDDFQNQIREDCETSIKQQLVFEAIADAENIEIDDEARQYVADQVGMDLDTLKESYADSLDASAKAYKVVQLIVDNAVIK